MDVSSSRVIVGVERDDGMVVANEKAILDFSHAILQGKGGIIVLKVPFGRLLVVPEGVPAATGIQGKSRTGRSQGTCLGTS